MFHHVTLGTNDWMRAKPFWKAVALGLELPVFCDHPHRRAVAYGNEIQAVGHSSKS